MMHDKIIDFMEDFFSQFGANPVLGRLLGVLICKSEPMNLEELAKTSDLSKPSVSIYMRNLEQFGYCRRLPRAKDRRAYYELESDYIGESYRRRLFLQQRMDAKLQSLLQQLTDFENNGDASIRKRLDQLARFQRLSMEAAEQTLERWKQEKPLQ